MTVDLFAGIRVRDHEAARPWYERLFGGEPTFSPHETESVWELAEHRFVYIVEDSEAVGGAIQTVFVDDFDEHLSAISERGLEPDERETYSNKVRKAIYRDPEGNEIGFGGPPQEGDG